VTATTTRAAPIAAAEAATPRARSARPWLRAVAAAVAAGTVAAIVAAVVDDGGRATDVLGPGAARVEIGIDHSAFDVTSIRVREGTLIEIVVRNDDPIDHELVLGPPAVHARHRTGDERRHLPVPGEVSVAPGDTALTFYELDEPGTYEYVCHLPGHEAYGMRGTIEVVPAA